MSTFDYISEARAIRDALENSHSDWRERIDESIAVGSTGMEILMAIRWNFTELLKAESTLPVELASRVKNCIAEANKMLK
jgi:hypothetical protein